MKQNLEWDAPVKSSENSGSENKNDIGKSILIGAGNFDIEKSDETITLEKHKEIIELNNKSVLHGYDMAIELLGLAKEENAVKLLIESKSVIEDGLKNMTNKVTESSE